MTSIVGSPFFPDRFPPRLEPTILDIITGLCGRPQGKSTEKGAREKKGKKGAGDFRVCDDLEACLLINTRGILALFRLFAVYILSVFCPEPWLRGTLSLWRVSFAYRNYPAFLGFTLFSTASHTQLMHVMHHSARPMPVIPQSSLGRTI